jgi:pimeloyl-ACP methyl ester carboxylesterase
VNEQAEDLPGEWTHRDIVTNGVRLHVVEAGVGPLVVLLHGFPEFWYSWHHQIPFLARSGFRVLAPDLRGYNLSDKPAGLDAYRLPVLVEDVVGLIRSTGLGKAIVIGHDWGGVIAWQLAMSRPDCVERLIILNAPHPALYQRELRTLSQLLKSWYVFWFGVPWLPELLCRWHNFALLDKALTGFSMRDLALHHRALRRPGALTAALSWYRAMLRSRRLGIRPSWTRIGSPVLVIWGERDHYLGIRLLDGLDEWAPKVQIERLPRAGHCVQAEALEAVNAALVRFFHSMG